VDSVILGLRQKRQVTSDLIDAINRLFSYRRKTITNIAKKFGKKMQSDKRLEELGVEEIIKLAKQIV
jgi:16S rRNA (adenine1518-N6/adenine1519-N6)-dimethyltransferase